MRLVFALALLALTVSDALPQLTRQQWNLLKAKRIRKEVRELSHDEWNRVVSAMWIMKLTSASDGRRRYGKKFKTYDSFVVRHAKAANSKDGDLAHFSPIFPVYHRLFVFEFEQTLMAIDPKIKAMPYWDFRLDDVQHLDKSVIFSDQYFGSVKGDPTQGYAVTNGRFAYWPIANSRDAGSPYANPFGLLRFPTNVLDTPYVARSGPHSCARNFTWGSSTVWDNCLASSMDITGWFHCFDVPVHGDVHWGVGGDWFRFPGQQDTARCNAWYGLPDGPGAGSFKSPWAANCFVCPSGCVIGVNTTEECQCTVTRNPCPGGWLGTPGYKITLPPLDEVQFMGDFLDKSTSPNDPIFMFHHANIDRFFYHYQALNYDQKNSFYGFPSSGYATGCNLNDTITPHQPFTKLYCESDGNYTVKDVFMKSDFLANPYTYKSVIDLLKPQ